MTGESEVKTLSTTAFILALFVPTLAHAEVHKCILDGHTTYSQKECQQPPILDSSATKKLNDEAASHGMSGFLDSSGGKRLTCAEAKDYNESHDRRITMASCRIDGAQAIERARKEGRDPAKSTSFLDACVEGSCGVGVWRAVEYLGQ